MGLGSQALCMRRGQPWTPVSLALLGEHWLEAWGPVLRAVCSLWDWGQVIMFSGLRGDFPSSEKSYLGVKVSTSTKQVFGCNTHGLMRNFPPWKHSELLNDKYRSLLSPPPFLTHLHPLAPYPALQPRPSLCSANS